MVKPSTVQSTLAVLTRGSESPGSTVRVGLVTYEPPGARANGWLMPRSGSLRMQLREGLSADEVFLTVMAK